MGILALVGILVAGYLLLKAAVFLVVVAAAVPAIGIPAISITIAAFSLWALRRFTLDEGAFNRRADLHRKRMGY